MLPAPRLVDVAAAMNAGARPTPRGFAAVVALAFEPLLEQTSERHMPQPSIARPENGRLRTDRSGTPTRP